MATLQFSRSFTFKYLLSRTCLSKNTKCEAFCSGPSLYLVDNLPLNDLRFHECSSKLGSKTYQFSAKPQKFRAACAAAGATSDAAVRAAVLLRLLLLFCCVVGDPLQLLPPCVSHTLCSKHLFAGVSDVGPGLPRLRLCPRFRRLCSRRHGLCISALAPFFLSSRFIGRTHKSNGITIIRACT